jgi:6-pyruvoyl-tetrahydropterin synthase
MMNPKTSLARRAYFSSGRQLRHPNWSDEQNRAAFGKDALPHGHDYVLDVYYQGEIGGQDGMIVNLTDIKPILARVLDQLDGKFLDSEVEYFRDAPPDRGEHCKLHLEPVTGANWSRTTGASPLAGKRAPLGREVGQHHETDALLRIRRRTSSACAADVAGR